MAVGEDKQACRSESPGHHGDGESLALHSLLQHETSRDNFFFLSSSGGPAMQKDGESLFLVDRLISIQ
jgi:hypothetical protein